MGRTPLLPKYRLQLHHSHPLPQLASPTMRLPLLCPAREKARMVTWQFHAITAFVHFPKQPTLRW